MRWSSYRSDVDGTERVGLVRDGNLYGLRGPDRLLDLLGDGGAALADAAAAALADPAEVLPVDTARLRAPIPVPPSIRDFMAFESHIGTILRGRGREVDPLWYEIPCFYFSNPAAVRGPRDEVALAPGTERFDFELEVAAVVGRAGSDLHPDEAESHLAGFMVMCDWSARDLQRREARLGLGPVKGKDTATSFGPVLVTPDELAGRRRGRAYDLRMQAWVNGRPYSDGNLADLYWSFGEMLAYASRGTTLRPGDVIGSGTVGTGCIAELSVTAGSDDYPWLRPGDRVTLEVAELGGIDAGLVAAAPVVPLR